MIEKASETSGWVGKRHGKAYALRGVFYYERPFGM